MTKSRLQSLMRGPETGRHTSTQRSEKEGIMAHRFIVMKRRSIGGVRVSYVSLVLTLLTLLSTPAAYVEAAEVEPAEVEAADVHAYASTPPARVDVIQQARSGYFSGVTFVRLVGVACPGRSDGYFIVPSDSKQPLELQVLLLALDRGFRVRMSGHDPSTCVTPSVSICATTSPC
jgi:hypothetical protein